LNRQDFLWIPGRIQSGSLTICNVSTLQINGNNEANRKPNKIRRWLFWNPVDKLTMRARTGLSEPGSDAGRATWKFRIKKVEEDFDRAVSELANAGADVTDPIEIPNLVDLLSTRAKNAQEDDGMFESFFSESNAPFATRKQAMASPLFSSATAGRLRWRPDPPEKHYAYSKARERLTTNSR
jgi:hypothetical protein